MRAAGRTMIGVALDSAQVEGRRVYLLWSDGRTDAIAARWLRDACTCPACRQTDEGQRLWELADLPVTTAVERADIEPDRLRLDFGDHVGWISLPALRERLAHQPPSCVFGVDHAAYLRSAAWPRERIDDPLGSGGLGSFVDQLDRFGIALATGVQTEPGEVLEFARSVGFVRETNYGALFAVRSVPNPDNLAYTTAGLSPHTDNPYRDPTPTVQLLHCLQPSSVGGHSQFVDGFAVAEQFRHAEPEAFRVLSSVDVRFRYHDAEVDLHATAPVIDLTHAGDVKQIRCNNRSMMPPPGDPDEVETFYDAYSTFVRMLEDPSFVMPIRLEAGDLIGFDNRRVLHGRSGYPINEPRHLQGCYIDIDAIRSAAAVARRAN